jgi:riboflavin synthase
MFTGLIQSISEIKDVFEKTSDGFKISILKPKDWFDLKLGESIACDGVCLTLSNFSDKILGFFVGAETLAKTTFKNLAPGKKINMERSLALGDRLGGHVVSGHIDAVSEVLEAKREGQCLDLKLRVTADQFRFIIPKGSLCVNGVSLTVNEVNRDEKSIGLFLIPETMARTNLSELKKGDWVNIETDQFVKIIAHQMGNYREHNP